MNPISFNLEKLQTKKHGTFQSDLRQIISNATQKPFPQIAKLTQHWPEDMLKESARLAEEHPAKFWNYYKSTKT